MQATQHYSQTYATTNHFRHCAEPISHPCLLVFELVLEKPTQKTDSGAEADAFKKPSPGI